METPSRPTQSPTLTDLPEGDVPVIREHIGIRPGYCGGKAHILGHRVKVEHIAIMHIHRRMSPAAIVEDIPTITLAQVHAALAYFYDHRKEIEAEIREADEFVERLRAGQPSILERIQQMRSKAEPPSTR